MEIHGLGAPPRTGIRWQGLLPAAIARAPGQAPAGVGVLPVPEFQGCHCPASVSRVNLLASAEPRASADDQRLIREHAATQQPASSIRQPTRPSSLFIHGVSLLLPRRWELTNCAFGSASRSTDRQTQQHNRTEQEQHRPSLPRQAHHPTDHPTDQPTDRPGLRGRPLIPEREDREATPSDASYLSIPTPEPRPPPPPRRSRLSQIHATHTTNTALLTTPNTRRQRPGHRRSRSRSSRCRVARVLLPGVVQRIAVSSNPPRHRIAAGRRLHAAPPPRRPTAASTRSPSSASCLHSPFSAPMASS